MTFEDKLEILAEDYGIDILLENSEINPIIVVRWLVEEGHLNLEQYFEDYWSEE